MFITSGLGYDFMRRLETGLILIACFGSIYYIFNIWASYIYAFISLAITTIEWHYNFPNNKVSKIFYFYCLLVHLVAPFTSELYLTITITEISDFFQMIFGRLCKGEKYIIEISPNKTLEGYIFGLFTSWLLFYLLGYRKQIILILFAGVLGDLYVSYVKRINHMKDCSNYLGDHGGWLDRIDSSMLAVLTVFLAQN